MFIYLHTVLHFFFLLILFHFIKLLSVTQMKSRDPSKMVAYIFNTRPFGCSVTIFLFLYCFFCCFFLLLREPKYRCLCSVLLVLNHLSEDVLTFALRKSFIWESQK